MQDKQKKEEEEQKQRQEQVQKKEQEEAPKLYMGSTGISQKVCRLLKKAGFPLTHVLSPCRYFQCCKTLAEDRFLGFTWALGTFILDQFLGSPPLTVGPMMNLTVEMGSWEHKLKAESKGQEGWNINSGRTSCFRLFNVLGQGAHVPIFRLVL